MCVNERCVTRTLTKALTSLSDAQIPKEKLVTVVNLSLGLRHSLLTIKVAIVSYQVFSVTSKACSH